MSLVMLFSYSSWVLNTNTYVHIISDQNFDFEIEIMSERNDYLD